MTRGARALAESGVADSEHLRTLTSRWTQSGSVANTAALTEATGAAGRTTAAELRSADRKVSLILVAFLLLVSWGWFAWFRRLIRRHRDLSDGMTERKVIDAGERRLLALVRNSTDVVAVIEPDSTATFLSPAVGALGWSPEELTGRPLLESCRRRTSRRWPGS